MQGKTGNTRQENSDTRRTELIQATLRVIAREGVKAATVRTISKEADVTQGLIRYYFRSKDELIAAAYESYMGNLVRLADETVPQGESAVTRLANFVVASVEAPVSSHDSVSIWAGFFEMLLHNSAMMGSHQRSYDTLRLHIKSLISYAFAELGRPTLNSELRRLSIAGNAILDGLWIEGGAMPELFQDGELARVGLDAFGAIVGIDLRSAVTSEG